MTQKFRHIALFSVLLIGVLGNVFATNLVHDGSKISVEKRAVGAESIKAWKAALNGGLNALRKDVNYLETLSPYSAGTLSRKFPSLHIAEEGLIRHYTGPAHDALNTALKGGNLTPELLEFKNVLNGALDKLPNYQNIVYRGLGDIESIGAEFWTVGQKIPNPAFVSSSTSANIAEQYMAFRGGNVVLKIESKTGKLIQEASLLPLDKEVLFRTGREFEVIQPATPKPGNPSILEVTLKEL